MNKPRMTALLWFLGGLAFLVSGWLSEPTRPLSFVAGVAFLLLGVLSLRR